MPKETIIRHEKSQRPTPISVHLITQLASDLSRLPDGTINTAEFESNSLLAFDVCTIIQAKLDALAKDDAQNLHHPAQK